MPITKLGKETKTKYKGQNVYVNSKGDVYQAKNLWSAADHLPTIKYDIEDSMLDEKVHWKLKNFNDFAVHTKRMNAADLTKPIILNSKGKVMDGRHRLMKAYLSGKTSLPAKRFIVDPKPDHAKRKK